MISLERLTPAAREVVEAARSASFETGTSVALVGGAVRDMLLNIEVRDLDFAAVGDAAAFVGDLASRLGVEPHHHARFGTWRLDVPALDPVDVVTARSESYAHPGALPDVAPGTLEDDLSRRDFPLNCIGWDLRSGELIDPTGGLADLRAGVLRILHPRSFEDDPTRVLRLFRLAERHGFTIEPSTRSLARQAIEERRFDDVSNERLRREIELAIDESAAPRVLARFGIERVIESLFETDRRVHVDDLESACLLAARHDADRMVVLLAVLLGEEACAATERFWGPGVARKVCLAARQARRARAVTSRSSSRCRLIAVSGRASVEGLAASLEPRFVELRRAWDGAQLPGDPLAGVAVSGPARGRAVRKGRLALASGASDADGAARIARAKALQYLEIAD